MAPDDATWGWFTEDQLVVRHPDGRMVDVGWYPDNDPAGRFRLEELASPRAVEQAGDPFGLCTLTVTAAGAVRLVNRSRGHERVFEEAAADWVVTTLRKLLDDAGFPSTPRHPIPGGPTRMLWDDDRREADLDTAVGLPRGGHVAGVPRPVPSQPSSPPRRHQVLCGGSGAAGPLSTAQNRRSAGEVDA